MKLPTVLTALCVSRADGNYNAQGKLGAAVLGNVETRVYQLLLYKGKQQHVSSVRISPSFQFVVRTEIECYNTSSEYSSLFPRLGYLTNVLRILHVTRSQWITIILCPCTVYLAKKKTQIHLSNVCLVIVIVFPWHSLAAWHIRWGRLSTCKSHVCVPSRAESWDCNRSGHTWMMHVTCVIYSVRPWLHSDVHIWVPSFWTLRMSGN